MWMCAEKYENERIFSPAAFQWQWVLQETHHDTPTSFHHISPVATVAMVTSRPTSEVKDLEMPITVISKYRVNRGGVWILSRRPEWVGKTTASGAVG